MPKKLYKHSEETKKRLSEIHKNLNHPYFTHKGRKHSKEAKEKMSLMKIGRKLSRETREKMKEARLKFWEKIPRKSKAQLAERKKWNEAKRRVRKVNNGGSHTFNEWQI